MGDKETFPGQPRGDTSTEQFRERQVLAAAGALQAPDPDQELIDCEKEVDARTADEGDTPSAIAKMLVKALIADLGPSRFDDIAVTLVETFNTEIFRQVSKNPA